MIKGMERVALMLKLDIRAVEVHPRGIRQDSSPKLTSIDYGKIVDNADRRYCGIGGRSDVDGGWRICFGQFAVSSPSRLTLRERKELNENSRLNSTNLPRSRQARCRRALARQVAEQLMANDALAAHARGTGNLGNHFSASRPGCDWLVCNVFPGRRHVVADGDRIASLCLGADCTRSITGFLGVLGAIGAEAGGANILRATIRVTFWGAFALALTAGIGQLFGTVF